ncbi:MAG: PilZ domain-containing protein [Chlamydiae bacterium]|nr:PilZ domain-containing protein [Chlamydiota bacterium]MBI3266882.1 PilZ domain-containing protein [Chlamydiota bacterium]
MSMFAHREKRAHPRIPFWTKVKVHWAHPQNGYVESETLGVENISPGGILVETSKAYPVNIPCEVFVRKDSHSDEIILPGTVIRSVSSRRGSFFDTGISFPTLSPEQKVSLDEIIKLYTSAS